MRRIGSLILLDSGAEINVGELWVDLERSIYADGLALLITGDSSLRNIYAYAGDGRLLWKIAESHDNRGYFDIRKENDKIIAYTQMGGRYEVDLSTGAVSLISVYK